MNLPNTRLALAAAHRASDAATELLRCLAQGDIPAVDDILDDLLSAAKDVIDLDPGLADMSPEIRRVYDAIENYLEAEGR